MNNEINSISYFVIESKEPERITQDVTKLRRE